MLSSLKDGSTSLELLEIRKETLIPISARNTSFIKNKYRLVGLDYIKQTKRSLEYDKRSPLRRVAQVLSVFVLLAQGSRLKQSYLRVLLGHP